MAIEKTSVKDILDKNYAEFDLGLLCEEAYKSLKHIDMVVYTLLNNQHGLSVKTTLNGSKRYVDKNGFIFVSIAQEKLCKVLRTTRPTLKASLDRLQALDLIEVVNVGNMKCNKIYVGKLKRTLTLGDYMKNMNIGEEDQEEYTPKIDVLHIEEAKKIAENKKAPSTPIDEADNQDIKKNNSSKSITQNKENDTKNTKENMESNSNKYLVFKIIEESCVNIRKCDLSKCEEEFTDMDRLKKALDICEDNNSNGIKALRLAYKNIGKPNKNSHSKGASHGVKDTFKKYTAKELEDLILSNQKGKFKDLEEGAIKFKANYMNTMDKN